MKRLPDNLSDLILIALADLEKIEETEGYTIDMAVWHAPMNAEENKRCHVCLAGAVMASTLGLRPNRSYSPASAADVIHRHTRQDAVNLTNKLNDLDNLRRGQVSRTTRVFKLWDDPEMRRAALDADRTITEYETDPEAFKLEMRNLSHDLARIGL